MKRKRKRKVKEKISTTEDDSKVKNIKSEIQDTN